MGPRTIYWRKTRRDTISTQFYIYLTTLRTVLLSKTWRDIISIPFCFYSTLLRTNCEWHHKQTLSAILSNVSQEEKWCTSLGQKYEETSHRIYQKKSRTICEWKHETSWAHLARSTWWDHVPAVDRNTRRHREHAIADVSGKITHNLQEKSQEDISAHISWPFCIFPTRWHTVWG